MNLKLTIGKLRNAWREYPSTRRQLQAIPTGRPIFVTGAHRSGTTWLAKMLAVPGLWYIHEPFNPNRGKWPESFAYARSEVTDDRIDRLMRCVLSGGLREALMLPYSDHPLMPLRAFPQPFKRVLVKDPTACLLTDYLSKHFDLEVLILFRHPAGFASSVSRLRWPIVRFLRQLLACGPLMEDHLAGYRSLMERNAHEDGVAAAAALHGALSKVLWRYAEKGVGRLVLFEEMCEAPVDRFAELFALLALPYNDAVRRTHEELCLDQPLAADNYHPHAVKRNSSAAAQSWKQELKQEEVTAIRAIWDQFGIPLYWRDEEWTDNRASGSTAP